MFTGSYLDNFNDAVAKNRMILLTGKENKNKISPKRKLTDKQVEEIRNNTQNNKRQMAKKYGVDEKVIRLILKNKEYLTPSGSGG